MYKSLALFFAYCLFGQSWAQSTLYQTSLEKNFEDAYELFHKEQYAASKSDFETLLEKPLTETKKVEARYYHAASALKLENPDGPILMEIFIIDHPHEAFKNTAAQVLGNYYFERRNYRNAIESFDKVETDLLYGEDRAEVLFKTGYAFFQLKNYHQAAAYFDQAKRFRSEYLADAYYYAGYIHMQNGSFEESVKDFKEAEKSRDYSGKVPYMLASIYYKQENFQDLIQYVSSILSRPGLEKKEEIYLLLAESYYENKDHSNAANYYDAYVKSQKGKLSRDQQYKAGVSHYETGKYQEASNFFKEVALGNDKLGQVASYYLGHSYIKLNNPQFASNSFSAAYKSDHDAAIKEEAMYNYAKVNLERGSFQEAVAALDTYLDIYPQGTHVRDVENLLNDALINTNNYHRAIEHMEKMTDKSDRIKAAYQKVAFYQGIAYFRDGKYSQAINFFDKAQTYSVDRNLLTQAQFWKGETHAASNNLQEAIKAYEKVIASRPSGNDPNLIKTHYGLGYAYYNTDQYAKAEEQFKAYTDKLRGRGDKENYEDAMIRLGDSYYVQKKFPEALEVFNKAISERISYTDYAYYMAGVTLNFENRNEEAINQLNQVINQFPNSRYFEDALFQKAQINMEMTRYSEAQQWFTELLNNRPNSPFTPYALEGRAVANYSLQNYDNAIGDYKKILDNHPNAANVDAALVGLQESLALQGRSGEFSDYLAGYKKANPSSSSLQNIEFEAAKNLFLNQSYQESIRAFESYIRSYPDVSQANEAKYFIGDAYYRLGNNEKALPFFYQLENVNDPALKNRAIQKLAELEFENENYSKAIPFFRSASENVRNKVEEYEAYRGLMLAYYETSQFDSADYFAERVLALGNITVDSEPNALLIKGKSMMHQGKTGEAEDTFLRLINESKSLQGAEALYLLAKSYNDKGEYSHSNELIFEHSPSFGGYDFWYGKSFILLAQNYLEMEEMFQAKATLESVVENSPNEEIQKEAEALLDTIND